MAIAVKNKMKHLFLVLLSTLKCLTGVQITHANVISDGTTGTAIENLDSSNFVITDGLKEGKNLFHSFQEFSIPTQGSVTFLAPNIENILTRVTGNLASKIDGTIAVSSNANLFLLNPKGISFGSSASLHLNGSFLATTAEQYVFENGSFFSATDLEPQGLLKLNLPIGLQFGEAPGAIVNRSSGREAGFAVGLRVLSGQTLALIGGSITLENAILSAPGGLQIFSTPGGQIELGSVSRNSFVTLSKVSDTFNLNYDKVERFQDIQIVEESVISVIGIGSGSIRMNGANIQLSDRSTIDTVNLGSTPSGDIVINASESLKVNSLSGISIASLSSGLPGNINIRTKRLIFDDLSFINANIFGLSPQGGNISIEASELIQISNVSEISSETFGTGNGGNISIDTSRLVLSEGGQITSATRSTGNGGTIAINADTIAISGSGLQPLLNTTSLSGIFAVSDSGIDGLTATGNGGEIQIAANSLSLINSGTISTATQAGNGGNINLDIDQRLVFNEGSISATAGSGELAGDGGNITIDAGFLIARPPGANSITANAFTGNGGNIAISSNALLGERFIDISASSSLGVDGSTSVTEDVSLQQKVDRLPDTPRALPKPRQGCSDPGGEASFSSKSNTEDRSVLEAQGWIAQANGSIALVHDLNLDTWELGQRYEAEGNFEDAKRAYEVAISRGYPEASKSLLSLLARLEPTQETLATMLKVQSEKQLTRLEDLLNCGEINLTSIYEIEKKPDAIVNIIELPKEQELKVIVSLPRSNGYQHQLATTVKLSDLEVSLRFLTAALSASNLLKVTNVEKFILEPVRVIHNVILEEIKEFLPESGKLLFILDGQLQNVPMALLQDRHEKYLIEKYAIAQTTIPYFYMGEEPHDFSALVAGVSTVAPSFEQINTLSIKPLPFIEQELNAVSNLPGKQTILLNEDFTLENLLTQAENYSIIHIAAHGRFSSIPETTYLTAYDKLITLKDFRYLVNSRGNTIKPLNLLVLSACKTARGDDQAALGLAGIAVRAGAESTIASLWQVNDEATAEWMEEFYTAWLVEGKTKIEAMRSAHLKILNITRDPRYWGAFILVGNWL